jgi:hypothetical protein
MGSPFLSTSGRKRVVAPHGDARFGRSHAPPSPSSIPATRHSDSVRWPRGRARREESLLPPPARPADHPGHRVGEAGYRRITGALFAAGLATFALIYSPDRPLTQT